MKIGMFAQDIGPKKMLEILYSKFSEKTDFTISKRKCDFQKCDVLFVVPSAVDNGMTLQSVIEEALANHVRIFVFEDVPCAARRIPRRLWKKVEVVVSTEKEVSVGCQFFKHVYYVGFPLHWRKDYDDILSGYKYFELNGRRVTIAGSKFPLRDLDLAIKLAQLEKVQLVYKPHPAAAKQNPHDYQESVIGFGHLFEKVNIWGADINTCVCIGASNLTIFTDASTMSVVADIAGCPICFLDTVEVRESFRMLGVRNIHDWPPIANGAPILQLESLTQVEEMLNDFVFCHDDVSVLDTPESYINGIVNIIE